MALYFLPVVSMPMFNVWIVYLPHCMSCAAAAAAVCCCCCCAVCCFPAMGSKLLEYFIWQSYEQNITVTGEDALSVVISINPMSRISLKLEKMLWVLSHFNVKVLCGS